MSDSAPKFSPSTLLALDLAIAHWARLRDGKEHSDEGPWASDCALCQLFVLDTNTCEGCPIAEATGVDECHATPYDFAFRAWRHRDTAPLAWRAAAEEMHDFLVSIKEGTFRNDRDI